MIFRIGVSVFVAALLLCAPVAKAQSWFTKELCTVTSIEIDPEGIDADLLAQLETEAAKIENSTGKFWKITSANGAVSHLWGTFHSSDPIILDLPHEFREVLSTAHLVAVELDPVFQSRAEIDRWNRGEFLWRDAGAPGAYVDLDWQVLNWIAARLTSLGFGDDMVQYLTPVGLASIVLDDPCNDFSYGIYPIQDSRIQLLGLDAGARVVGLESKDAFVETLSRDDRLETTLAVIEAYGAHLNPNATNAGRQSGFALYLQGRLGELIAWERQYFDEFFGQEKSQRLLSLVNGYLVDERNLGFLESATPLLTKGNVVLAVGSYHLPGKKGLVSLLRRAGFRVERVWVEGEIRRD